MSAWIYLNSGRQIDVESIENFNFAVDDFIHPLTMINRYTGNTKAPYSVGEHSLIGSGLEVVKKEGLARAFFLHDFSEVLMSDIPSPVKRMVPDYITLEERVQQHIFSVFDEPWENMARLHQYDKRMCQDEMMQVFNFQHDCGMEPLGFKVEFLHWQICKSKMNVRAKELGLT